MTGVLQFGSWLSTCEREGGKMVCDVCVCADMWVNCLRTLEFAFLPYLPLPLP